MWEDDDYPETEDLGRKKEGGKAGPFFNLTKGKNIDWSLPYSEFFKTMKNAGFELVIQNESYHYRERNEEKNKDEATLWHHPAGLMVYVDTYTGGFTNYNKKNEEYVADLRRFNSMHIYWQAKVGGGQKGWDATRGISASGGAKPLGDGTLLINRHESFTQGGDLTDLMRRINLMGGLVPVAEWTDEFLYVNPCLYLEYGSDAHQQEDLTPDQKKALAIAQERMIAKIQNPHVAKVLDHQMDRGKKGGWAKDTPESERLHIKKNCLAEMNTQLSHGLTCANMRYQEPEASTQLLAWSEGRLPKDDEQWASVGRVKFNALHALPFMAGPDQLDQAKKLLNEMPLDQLQRLANAQDSRGVTPFMNYLILARETQKTLAFNAMELLEIIVTRLGSKIDLNSEKNKMGALNFLLANPLPNHTVASNVFGLEEPIFAVLALCEKHGVPLLNCFYPKVGERRGDYEIKVERGGPVSGSEAIAAFSNEAQALDLNEDRLRSYFEKTLLDDQIGSAIKLDRKVHGL